MRELRTWLLILFLAAFAFLTTGAAARNDSSLPPQPEATEAASHTASASEEPARLEGELNQLRELLDAQAKQFQAQLAEQRQRIQSLEEQLKAQPKVSETAPQSVIAARSAVSASASAATEERAAAPPPVIPAITPLRFLPVGGAERGALKPAFNAGPVRITPYGNLKATFVQDSSSPGGDDFPLPGFLADSGPTASPEFHIKARSSRLGMNFEWLDASEKLAITGKIEIDFEGNFSRADNRNLSSIRSSMPSLRLAWGRLDYKLTSQDTLSALFGQDWSPFASSTLPPLLETTIIGGPFGGLWERQAQFRFGWTHNFGAFQFMPEVAIAMPAVGDTPSAANVSNQLGYGERQGADSDQPEMQARVVFQWQLDHAPGVAPAQIIFSGEHGARTAIVLASAVPTAYAAAFHTGATVSSDTDGWTGEWQLPSRFATLIGKYYSGSDLRWFFGGELFSNFNDTAGLTNIATASSTDGASTVAFGLRNGVPVVAPQRPIRAGGGFTSLGLPLSRLFRADPDGRQMGWTMYLTYGTDQAKTRDLLRLEPNGSRSRSDMSVGTIQYKLNNWVTFAFEQSLYRTRANTEATAFPLFMGSPQHEWKDIRSEGGTIFSF